MDLGLVKNCVTRFSDLQTVNRQNFSILKMRQKLCDQKNWGQAQNGQLLPSFIFPAYINAHNYE